MAQSPSDLTIERMARQAAGGSLSNPRGTGSTGDVAGHEQAHELISDMRLVKRARFNAQARFEAKHMASVIALTLATVFELALSLAGTIYGDVLTKETANLLDFTSHVTAVFILGFGLVVGLGNYQTKALYMQTCALDVGDLARELRLSLPASKAALLEYAHKYHELKARCPPNHGSVDFERAILDKNDKREVKANRWSYRLDVYGIYALIAVLYSSFLLVSWLLLGR